MMGTLPWYFWFEFRFLSKKTITPNMIEITKRKINDTARLITSTGDLQLDCFIVLGSQKEHLECSVDAVN